ncbi:MAG TPA: ROK family transcriptional regulator [Pilimelia sp.]|nr:ROK family transcriptional regulator [Pilimelia sp.]
MQSGPQPADFADVRATNLAVVLGHVRANAPCSRADIAAATGLNKATVSSLVADLIDRRLLRETGQTEHRIGRPATMLVVDGQLYAAIGVQVGTDHLTAVAVDLAGNRLLSWRRSFAGLSATPGRAVAAIAALAGRAGARASREGREVLGLTVGVPGLVDSSGVVRLAPNLGWRDLDLRGELRAAQRGATHPVDVANDADLAVLAEHRYGAHAGTANLVYLTGDVGIGAGVVCDGRLLRGTRGFTGEIGHVQVRPDGPPCGCGRRGCLEAVAGAAALVRRALPEVGTDEAIEDFAPEVEEIARRARAGDGPTLKALGETGRELGHGISVLANVVNPEVVVLGGYFAPLARWLVPAAEAELAERSVAPDAGGCRLVASALGADATAVGGAARVLDDIDAGHLPAPR